MAKEPNYWTKEELKVYVLLLCAKADTVVTEDELKLIKAKTEASTFKKMQQKIATHDEKKSLKKIQKNLVFHDYCYRELAALRSEMNEVFLADTMITLKEHSLDEILDNILY